MTSVEESIQQILARLSTLFGNSDNYTHYHTEDRNRGNHTGVQNADTVIFHTVTKSAAYTFERGVVVVLADATAAGFTVTLPPPALVKFQVVTIKKIDATANAVVADSPTGNVDGAATLSNTTTMRSLSFLSDGTDYWTI